MKQFQRPAFFVKALALLSLCIMLFSCARYVKETSHLQADARYHILIASDASDFKDVIRNRLVDHYKTTSNIDVVNLSALENIQGEKYDAIVIMDSCWVKSHLNLSFKEFLDGLKDESHVVLFLTTGSHEWDYQYKSVDAITSASVVENEESVFKQLKSRIDKVLMGANQKRFQHSDFARSAFMKYVFSQSKSVSYNPLNTISSS